MITEHAVLNVIEGQEDEFLATMAQAKHLISASPGFRSLSMQRCIEHQNVFLLLVQWDSLEAHTEGFRGSPAYEQWRALLHHFYDPHPVVEHFSTVVTA